MNGIWTFCGNKSGSFVHSKQTLVVCLIKSDVKSTFMANGDYWFKLRKVSVKEVKQSSARIIHELTGHFYGLVFNSKSFSIDNKVV